MKGEEKGKKRKEDRLNHTRERKRESGNEEVKRRDCEMREGK